MPTKVDSIQSAEWRRIIELIQRVAPTWRSENPSIVSIRPGFRRVDGLLTEEKAIIAELRPTSSPTEATQLQLPPEVDGIPVEIRRADPREIELGEDSLANWGRVHAGGILQEAGKRRPEIGYTPPPTILEAREVRDILCHIGPDAGWTVLREFLAGPSERLSVSMYELTAEHIIEALTELSTNDDLSMEMVLQENGDEAETVESLQHAWAQRLTYAPAVLSGPNRIFANSYHTKVAVRDGKQFWLSSGNWSPHSQPVVGPDDQSPYRLGNREWHVVVNDEPLSEMFETYVRWDRSKAAEVGAPEMVELLPELLVPESALLELEAAVVQEPFPPQQFTRSSGQPGISIQPLMTPDNYGENILSLINGAATSLWMQYAYVREPSYEGVLEELVTAVARKMADDSVEVRVIVDSRNELPKHIDFLLAAGWDPAKFRKQRSKVHNKGIIVDGRFTVVGSQNWSSDGVEFNRDASLIIDSPEVAGYFGKVFDFDWENLTKPIQTSEITPVIAEAGVPTPPGMVRIPWRSWYAG
jgi:hypothetical protein